LKPAQPTPIATLLLIAANLAAAFVLFWQPDLLETFGFVPDRPSPLAALTSLFLHANLIHLLGNMVFLAAAGPATESAVGPLKLLGVYFAGGLVGVAAHWMLGNAGSAPLIGASGAVAACAALAGVRFHRVRVPLAPSFQVPLLAVVVAWLLLQVLGGVIRFGEEYGGVSYWAHVGGVVAGLLLALAFRAGADAERAESRQAMWEMDERGPAAALAAAELHLKLHPTDPEALLRKAEALAQLGEKEEACQIFAGLLERLPDSRLAEAAERATAMGCLEGISSSRRTRLAHRLSAGRPELALQLLESVVKGPAEDSERPDAMLALAELRRANDPEGANRLVSELFERYPLHPAAEIARAKGWPA
jgi:membrane associated rhomboid family serine protease